MKRIRFNIARLMVVVLFVAVGFAGLREANESWDSGLFALTLVVLLCSILLAIHRTEKRGAFWLGFALFGSAYLGLSLVPSIESRLITTRGLVYLDSKIPRSIRSAFEYFDYDSDGETDLFVTNYPHPIPLQISKGNGTIEDVTPAAESNTAWVVKSLVGSSGTTFHFARIGHSLVALIAAFLGGLLSRYVFAQNREPVSGSVKPQG